MCLLYCVFCVTCVAVKLHESVLCLGMEHAVQVAECKHLRDRTGQSIER
jgi:hypothetical protein